MNEGVFELGPELTRRYRFTFLLFYVHLRVRAVLEAEGLDVALDKLAQDIVGLASQEYIDGGDLLFDFARGDTLLLTK